jgi:hypothetical protein
MDYKNNIVEFQEETECYKGFKQKINTNIKTLENNWDYEL